MSVSMFILHVEGNFVLDYECFGMCRVFGWVGGTLYVFGGESDCMNNVDHTHYEQKKVCGPG